MFRTRKDSHVHRTRRQTDFATLARWAKAHLGELFAAYPALQLLTGDALFCQRLLARLIVEAGRDYLFAVKDNQPDLHEAVQTAFADAIPETADAATREKKGARW